MSKNGMLEKENKMNANEQENIPPYLRAYNEIAIKCTADSINVLLGEKDIEEYRREVDALVEAEHQRRRRLREEKWKNKNKQQ